MFEDSFVCFWCTSFLCLFFSPLLRLRALFSSLSGCVFVYDVSLKLSTLHTCCLTNLCLFYSSVSNHSLYLFPTPFLIFHCSFLEQPVDHSLPIPELVLDQQLCVQLPAPMAPQSNNQPRKRRLPPMVRCMQTYICLKKNKTKQILIKIK